MLHYKGIVDALLVHELTVNSSSSSIHHPFFCSFVIFNLPFIDIQFSLESHFRSCLYHITGSASRFLHNFHQNVFLHVTLNSLLLYIGDLYPWLHCQREQTPTIHSAQTPYYFMFYTQIPSASHSPLLEKMLPVTPIDFCNRITHSRNYSHRCFRSSPSLHFLSIMWW